MNTLHVAVVPDEATPTSGTAVVRISGLTTWPENATLSLLPIDEAAVPANSAGWPWEPIKPQQVTLTDTGVDIVLGPEVVASPKLLPGTPLTIKVAAANFEVEARWPTVVPLTPRRTTAVAMTAAQLLAAKTERERIEKLAAAQRQERVESAVRSASSADGWIDEPSARTTSASDMPRSTESGRLARLGSMRRKETPDDPEGSSASVATGSIGQLARLAPAPAANIVPMPTPPPPRRSRRTIHIPGFIAGLLTMAAIAAVALTLGPPTWWHGGLGGAGLASATDQVAAADLRGIFKDIVAAGAQSPRSKSAANVDVATALSLADHSLRGQRTQTETEEAEFWLKRALASSMGGQDIGWALTQLGTIYATAGTPNHSYAKAHAIWELAAAQGDPVAHCFLGALYEHGLGVQKNNKAAREHYLAAEQQGACPTAKEAAARLSE